MEPDNKWALLTGIYLMKNIDFVQFYSKIIETLGVLKEKDNLRENYYNDLRKLKLRKKIFKFIVLLILLKNVRKFYFIKLYFSF